MKKNIGIWGPRDVGKTTYLSVLYHDCMSDGWKMKAADQASDDFRLKNYKLLFEQGQFPLATRPQDVDIYTYDVSRNGSLGIVQSYRLVLADASGEWFENPTSIKNQFPDVLNPYERLIECTGLVLLIDPKKVQENQPAHFVTISRALGSLSRASSQNSVSKPIIPDLAVCFTKMDRQEFRYNLDLEGEKMEMFARDILGDHIYQDILAACDRKRVRFFGCTSIGLEHTESKTRNHPKDTTEVSGINSIDPHKIKPKNIFKPIEWLLR